MGLLEDRRRAIAEGLLGTTLPAGPQMEAPPPPDPLTEALLTLFGGYVPMFTQNNAAQRVGMLPMPVVSDVAGLLGDLQMYAQEPEERTLLNYGLSAAGLLPFVPGAFGVVKGVDDGLLGRFKTTTPGRIVKQTKEGGGYSVNLPTGQLPDDGLMMGMYRNTDPRNMVLDAFRRPDVERFAKTNAEQLAKQDRYMGTWRDPDTGKVYLDVSRRFAPGDIRQATKFGERTGQLAGWNAGAKEPFPVGNWEDFVRSPEFAARLTQMGQEGRDYLKNFPANEWWDMHGGAFERVYGAGNLPQVAGFTASTAPNAAPRENLQTMSEYMRRHIKGEPILQPEWRVPPGEMSRQAGKQIGMESARANNLLKSEAGLLGELRRDKVREEALALMGDPSAVVLDRHWARLAEDPARGIFTAGAPGIIEPGKQYLTLKDAVVQAAARAGRAPRDFSADVWTGIREHIKNNSDLFGQKFRGSAITGDSKSYADHFEHLIEDKAKHLGIAKDEMEKRLRKGDATLMSALLATPFVGYLYSQVTGEPDPSGVQ